MVSELKVTTSAMRTIEQESISSPHGWETGGILIGTLRTPMVIAATGPGPRAQASAAHFSSDPVHEQAELDRAIERSGGRAKLAGYWHRHPGGFAKPSGGDIRQATQLLSSGGPLYLFIANVAEQGVHPSVVVHAYRFDNEGADPSPVRLTVVKDASREVLAALECEPVLLRADKQDYWSGPGFQFYRTPSGRERLRADVDELTHAGLEVAVLRMKGSGRAFLDIRAGRMGLLCLFPPEYPLNPPKFVWKANGAPAGPSETLLAWSSDVHLREAVEGVLAPERPLVGCPRTPEPKTPNGGRTDESGALHRYFPTFVGCGRLVARLLRAPVRRRAGGRGDREHHGSR
ncbi:MAG: hypothetical protein FJ291_10215 [Planctomycetes bacterium]|nr:hypothetical protein [Planctomycetota bacterium]